jgi:ABC-2 type transport system ATP-binding protein
MNGCNTPHFPSERYSAAMHSSPDAAVLRIAHLSLRWPDGKPLFTDLSLDIGPGVTLLRGDSGSGKTSLLRLVAGNLVAKGRIALHGRTREDDRAAWDRDVALSDADDPRLDALTAAGVMAALRERHGALDEPAWQRHLDGFALQPHLAKAMFQLSTGTRRKVVLAAALAMHCPLTLLDEPGAGLDAASLRHLRQALTEADRDTVRAVLVVVSFGLDGLECNATVTLPGQESA